MFHLMHRLLRLNSITSRFFFWIMLLVVLTSMLYLISYVVVDKNKRLVETQEYLNYGLENQQIIMENWAKSRSEEVRLLASFQVIKDLQLESMAERFLYYHEYYEQLNALVFIDVNGHVRIDTGSNEVILEHPQVSLKDRDYFIDAQQGNESMYDIVLSKATGNPVIIFPTSINSDDGTFLGVIFGAAHLSEINQMLSKTLQRESSELILINENNTIVTHLSHDVRPDDNQMVTQLEANIIEEVHGENNRFFEYINQQGNEKFGAAMPLFDGRYFLIHTVDKKDILQSHYQMIWIMLSLTFLVIVLAFIFIVPVSKRLSQPFFKLVLAIQQMTAGNYRTTLVEKDFETSPVELQQMMSGFNEMATSIRENEQLLEKISQTDGLTGVANRRLFDIHLEKEWTQALDDCMSISLIFIDVDYFKQYNDLFGHQAGDETLKKIAQAIDTLMVESHELFARYGGEEFVIVIRNQQSDVVVQRAKQVQERVKELKIMRSKEDVNQFVTVSIGVATVIPKENMTKESLIELADQALYEAKSLGRNRIIVK